MNIRNIFLSCFFATASLNADDIQLYQDDHRAALCSFLERYPELLVMGDDQAVRLKETERFFNSNKYITKVCTKNNVPVGFITYVKEGYQAPFIENVLSFDQSKPIQSKLFGVIQLLCVSEQNQCKGIGKVLVLEALKDMREKGVEVIMLQTKVNNLAARALYEKCGFKLWLPIAPNVPDCFYRFVIK